MYAAVTMHGVVQFSPASANKRSTFGSYTFFTLYYSKRSLFNFVMLYKSKSYPKLRFGIAFPFWFFYCSKLRKEV